MCPDAELLSAYFDGEVPEPWKSRMEAHLASCPACSERLAGFSSLSAGMSAGASGAEVGAGCARAWNRIEADLAKRGERRRAPSVWNRSVRVPIPLAAAALLALSIVPAVTVASLDRRGGPALAARQPGPTASGYAQAVAANGGGNGYAVPADANFQDIASLIRYLDSQDLPVTINVELPADRSYGYSGPPELIKVSDDGSKKGGR